MTPTSWAPYRKPDSMPDVKRKLAAGCSLGHAARLCGMTPAELDLALWRSLGGVQP